jgi:hypothetical protein
MVHHEFLGGIIQPELLQHPCLSPDRQLTGFNLGFRLRTRKHHTSREHHEEGQDTQNPHLFHY